ncbi:hypothetical protein AB205_0162730, partial [Aquarana catesbeiana]
DPAGQWHTLNVCILCRARGPYGRLGPLCTYHTVLYAAVMPVTCGCSTNENNSTYAGTACDNMLTSGSWCSKCLGDANKLKHSEKKPINCSLTVPIKRSHCAYQLQPLYHQTQPLCHQTQPLCPSNAATVPIKCCHCAHQMVPLCSSNAATVPSNAAAVPINCSHCAHQLLPLCPSNAATVPIKCSHCAHKMLPLCHTNAATVPIECCHCAIKCCHRAIECRHCDPPCPLAVCLALTLSRRPITTPVISANQVMGNRPEHLIGGEAVQC